jgi:hypothetical protein
LVLPLLLLSLVWPAVAAEHRGKCAGAWFGRRRLPLRVYARGDLDPLAQPRQDLLYLPLSEVVEIPLAERHHAMAVDYLVLFPEGSQVSVGCATRILTPIIRFSRYTTSFPDIS